MKTQRPHFEELDWLDYVQDRLGPDEYVNLEGHRAGCSSCQERLAGLRRLANALPALEELLGGSHRQDLDNAFVARAAHMADDTNEVILRARQEVEKLPDPPPPPSNLSRLSEAHVIAALQSARELFTNRFERAQSLIDWANDALGLLRLHSALEWPGIEGSVRSYLAYLTFRGGAATNALEELAAARSFLDLPMPLRDLELAFWCYVRASCLHNLSRFDEALQDIVVSEQIYSDFGDKRRFARSRFLHSVLVFDGGAPFESLPMFSALLTDEALKEDRPIFALLNLGFANNLVFVGDLPRAKSAYARAVRLLKETGQSDQLFRVRVGLADIAQRQGRIEEALAINLQLRPELRKRHLPWDEVRRELWIIRDLLALDRFTEAQETCRALARRAESLSLALEARRALAYLAEAEHSLDVAEVVAIADDLRKIARGMSTRWSAA